MVVPLLIILKGLVYLSMPAGRASWRSPTAEQLIASGANFGPLRIPPGQVFVLGDCRDESFDSRTWGPVPLKDVWGKVFMIYYSQDQNTARIRWERMGCAVR